jgi:hypothetical protein
MDTMFDKARALLRAGGAHELPHPGGTLLAHLERTRETLRAWAAGEALELAGLCHAMYGTQGFPHMLLPLAERDALRMIIGDEAEQIVYAYCSFDRGYRLVPGERPIMRDRFVGAECEAAPDVWRALAELTAANELDVLRHAELTAQQQRGILALLQGCDSLLSSAGRAAVARALDSAA